MGEAGTGFTLVAQPLVGESRAHHGWRICNTICYLYVALGAIL